MTAVPSLLHTLADEETEACGDGALSAEGPEAQSQAFDPNLCAQLPPAATSPKLLSSGTRFSTKGFSILLPPLPRSHQSEDKQPQLVAGSTADRHQMAKREVVCYSKFCRQLLSRELKRNLTSPDLKLHWKAFVAHPYLI